MIATNLLVFLGVKMGWIAFDEWVSDWSSWNPLGWLSSAFLHAEVGHIAGNMIGLWVFGQILEGAVGTRAFLLCCLVFVLGSGAAQTLAFHAVEGGSHGASGLVYAIIAAGCLAAPKTKIQVLLWFYVQPRNIAVPTTMLAAVFVVLEIMNGILHGAASIVIHAGEAPRDTGIRCQDKNRRPS